MSVTLSTNNLNPDATGFPNTGQEVPHSKVVHCRAIPEGCRETELIRVMKLFGDVEALRLIPKKNQALVEYQTLDSSIACVTYGNLQPIIVCGCQIYVNYSKSTQITRHFNDSSASSSSPEQEPTHVLLLTIINVIHPVDVEVIKTICEKQEVQVQRIVFFHKNGLQALVEFENIEDATHIHTSLNGCDIYPGCCTLRMEYSNTERLNVRQNTTELYNIDIINDDASPTGYRSESQNDKLMKKLTALLGDHENINAVQNIILKVLAGGTMNNPQKPTESQGLLPTVEIEPQQQQRTPLLETTEDYNNVATNFSQLCNVSSGRVVGGMGCVAMVYGVNNDVLNCNHLFNLFCMYGNVIKVKMLTNKPGCAMVQFAARLSTEHAIRYLNGLTLFGQQFQVTYSKHPYIADSTQSSALFDGSSSVVNFHDSLNNRFKYVQGNRNDRSSMIHQPSKVLHYFNAPPDYSAEQLQHLFQSYSAETPSKHVTIPKPNSRSSLGLLEFSSVAKSIEAAMLVNHVTVRKTIGDVESALSGGEKGSPFTLKLAFSSSESINS